MCLGPSGIGERAKYCKYHGFSLVMIPRVCVCGSVLLCVSVRGLTVQCVAFEVFSKKLNLHERTKPSAQWHVP